MSSGSLDCTRATWSSSSRCCQRDRARQPSNLGNVSEQNVTAALDHFVLFCWYRQVSQIR
jgi:hypothetical protein